MSGVCVSVYMCMCVYPQLKVHTVIGWAASLYTSGATRECLFTKYPGVRHMVQGEGSFDLPDLCSTNSKSSPLNRHYTGLGGRDYLKGIQALGSNLHRSCCHSVKYPPVKAEIPPT